MKLPLKILFPWPHKALSPNARVHWTAAASAKRGYRKDWFVLAKKAGWGFEHETALHLDIVFYPPDKRSRDLDNMLASIKSGLDGLADAIGVDDRYWGLTITRGNTKATDRPVGVAVTILINKNGE